VAFKVKADVALNELCCRLTLSVFNFTIAAVLRCRTLRFIRALPPPSIVRWFTSLKIGAAGFSMYSRWEQWTCVRRIFAPASHTPKMSAPSNCWNIPIDSLQNGTLRPALPCTAVSSAAARIAWCTRAIAHECARCTASNWVRMAKPVTAC
jgi:hypothetical protein